MPLFSKTHVLILPHAEEYRRFFAVSVKQVLDCLNTPDLREGLNTDHYTAEKTLQNRRLHVYYFLTYPLSASVDEVYAIVDFVGCTEVASAATEAVDLSADRQDHPTANSLSKQ